MVAATTPRVVPESKEQRIEHLKRELISIVDSEAASLLRKAQIIKELEESGENFSEWKRPIPFFNYLRRIACGQMLPEVLVRFGGNAEALNRISQLPLQDQKRLADGEQLKLLFYKEDGTLDQQSVDPAEVNGKTLRRLIAKDNHILSEGEQSLALREWQMKRQKKSHKRTRASVAGCLLDWERGGIDVPHKMYISKADLKEILRRLEQ